jgi:hypothetical protein
MDPLAAHGAPAQAGQVGFGAGFIKEDQPRRVPRRLLTPPVPPRPDDIRPFLFTGAECLFLYVSPMAAKT